MFLDLLTAPSSQKLHVATKLLKANSICLEADIDRKSLCFPSTWRDDTAILIFRDLLIYRLFKYTHTSSYDDNDQHIPVQGQLRVASDESLLANL